MIGPAESSPNIDAKAERFSGLTESLRPFLLRQACCLTRNVTDAEDLVQETYLRAFRFFETFREESSVKTWLLRIMKNLFINQRRNGQARYERLFVDRSRSSEDWDPPAEGRLHEMNAREKLTGEELDEEITVALRILPDAYREIMLLAAIMNYTYEEMSVILVCPVGTVRSRLSRAKTLLRRKLGTPARRYGYASN